MILPNDNSPLTNPFHSDEDENWIASVIARYEFEDRLTAAVRQGQPDTVRELLAESTILEANEFSYLPLDGLELARQGCRVMNVLCRVAARSGGLPPLYVHNISEKFGLIIGRCEDMKLLKTSMPMRIAISYAKAVLEFSTNSYSPLVKDAVNYISAHLTMPIEVSGIAAGLFVSPEHLSRRFKQETGKTINTYIHHHRIALAKVLFAQGNTNITDVAARIGFHDNSHFSRTFKKICGVSPKEYISML